MMQKLETYFEESTKAGHGIKVQCPCHEDNQASLSVWIDENGKLCWNCFAGCEHMEVGKALAKQGIPMSFEMEPTRYEYKDESGKLLYTKVKKPGKQFYIDWISKERRILYNTHKLPSSDNLIIVVEGEKDCETLGKQGLLAVCNDDGAGKWKQDYAEQLRSKDVVIIPDNDAPGYKHANIVLGYLRDAAGSVNILDIQTLFGLIDVAPWKGADITDWFEKGGTVQLLKEQLPESGASLLQETRDAFKTTLCNIERRYHEPADNWGLKTGLTDLDEITGGLQKGDLIVLAARPSMGKTSLGMCIARNLMHSKHVMFFSAEMSRESLQTRLLCSIAEIDSLKIRSQDLNQRDFGTLVEAAASCSLSNLIIDETSPVTIETIITKATATKPDLVIVDYLQLIKSEEYPTDRRLGVDAVSQGLKALAKNLNIPVVALAQLKREVETRQVSRKDAEPRSPVMSDLKESSGIEQDADLIGFLWEHANFKGCRELTIAKHRNGPTGHVRLQWDARLTKFSDYAKYNEPTYNTNFDDIFEDLI